MREHLIKRKKEIYRKMEQLVAELQCINAILQKPKKEREE